MKKTVATMLTSILLFSLAACTGEATSNDGSDPSATVADEAALTASAATKRAIKTSVGIFAGGDARRTRTITLAQAPAAVRAKLTAARARMVADMEENSWSESDLEGDAVYEVFKGPRSRTVVGYAIWLYGDNGDAGRGLIRGFDLEGRQIVSEEDGWAEE
jgi:hypothetical protein